MSASLRATEISRKLIRVGCVLCLLSPSALANPRSRAALHSAGPSKSACLAFGTMGLGAGVVCPPCGPLYCIDPAAADSAREAKKAELRALGYPERLLKLLDKYKCVACILFAPDNFRIMMQYAPGKGPPDSHGDPSTHVTYQWTPQQEALARKELRQGVILAYYVFNSRTPCKCCNEADPRTLPSWNGALEMNMDGVLAYTSPGALGPVDHRDRDSLGRSLDPDGNFLRVVLGIVHVQTILRVDAQSF